MGESDPHRPDGDAEEAQALLFGVISVAGTLLMLAVGVQVCRVIWRWYLGSIPVAG